MKRKTDEKIRQIFAARVKQLRTEQNMTQTDLAYELTKINMSKNDRAVSISTVSNWEKAKAFPNSSNLKSVASILNTSVAYLLGEGENDQKTSATNNSKYVNNDDEIKRHAGEPVYVITDDIRQIGKWGIVKDDGSAIFFSDGSITSLNKIKGSVKRCPIPFAYAPDSNAKMLSPKEVRKTDATFWVEGIGGDYDARQRLKGWYSYDKTRDAAVDAAFHYLPMNTYGLSWCAFESQFKYQHDL